MHQDIQYDHTCTCLFLIRYFDFTACEKNHINIMLNRHKNLWAICNVCLDKAWYSNLCQQNEKHSLIFNQYPKIDVYILNISPIFVFFHFWQNFSNFFNDRIFWTDRIFYGTEKNFLNYNLRQKSEIFFQDIWTKIKDP